MKREKKNHSRRREGANNKRLWSCDYRSWYEILTSWMTPSRYLISTCLSWSISLHRVINVSVWWIDNTPLYPVQKNFKKNLKYTMTSMVNSRDCCSERYRTTDKQIQYCKDSSDRKYCKDEVSETAQYHA